ncbi:MAG: DUF6259 domain-containing protein [Pirellulales bacterium]
MTDFQLHANFDAEKIEPLMTVIDPNWIAMCPQSEVFRHSFLESAVEMVGTSTRKIHQIWMEPNLQGCHADVLYYDIGPCAGIPTHCYAANHSHPPGAGRDITQAHRTLLLESQSAATRAAGKYIPIGTECISGAFLDVLDFYYPRNAGLSIDMELFPWVRELTWLPDGKMEIVPLFQFVYHGYAPLAIQGIYSFDPWTVPASLDYCTWSEARSYLWGGIVITMPPRDNTVSEKRLRYLQSLTTARTEFARAYLANGVRMLRPPKVECGPIQVKHGLDADGWFRKVRYGADASSQASAAVFETKELAVDAWINLMLKLEATPARTDSLSVPTVQSAAYLSADEKLGIILINLGNEELKQLEVDLAPIGSGWQVPCNAKVRSQASEHELGLVTGRAVVNLPSQQVILLELTKQH